MRAGQLRSGSKAETMLNLLREQGEARSVPEIMASTNESERHVRARLFELCGAGHVIKVIGSPVRFEALGRAVFGPAVAMPLPVVRAALPKDRSLRPHVGVVVLLDRRAA